MRWAIGKVGIHQIIELEEGVGQVIQSIIKNATPNNVKRIGWLFPDFADKEGNLKALVQSFLIRSEGKNILIDACNGNGKARTEFWGNLNTDFLQRLAKIGVAPEDVHAVVCTHIHTDHVGWNTRYQDGAWTPTFPHAKFFFAREEYEYWARRTQSETGDDRAVFEDSVAPIIRAGLAELVDADCKISQNLSLIPAPGHTPGHVCVRVDSDGEQAVISGDLFHHPCQIANPNWTTDGDSLPDKVVETRERILKQIADNGALLIGSHFANPVAGRIEMVEGGFVLRRDKNPN